MCINPPVEPMEDSSTKRDKSVKNTAFFRLFLLFVRKNGPFLSFLGLFTAKKCKEMHVFASFLSMSMSENDRF